MSVNDLGWKIDLRARRDATSWRYWINPAMAAVDVLTVYLVVGLSSLGYHLVAYGHTGDAGLTLELATLIAAIFLFTNLMQGRYRLTRYLSARGQMLRAFNVWNVTMMAFVIVAFLAKVLDNYSRAVVLLSYVVGIPVIAYARRGVSGAIAMASRTGRIASERVLIVGRQRDVLSFAERHKPWNIGFAVVDAVFIPDEAAKDDAAGGDAALAEALGLALARVRDLGPDAVFIALPWSRRAAIEACVDAFMTVPVAIHLAPEAVMDRFQSSRIARVGALATLQLTRRPLSTVEVLVKRLVDLVGAVVGLVVLAPVFLAIAVALKIEGKGSVLFAQRRYGFNQQPFRIWKFRTMTASDDGDTVAQAVRGDARVTRVGRFLRRYNLDELPQLVNVLGGSMSLVGPRPHALAHDREFERKIALYARRHNVKPGITGWAQIHGLRGITDSDDKMARRVAHDLWYIDNWSVWLDLAILARTFSVKAFTNAV